jgi:transcriptional regulator of arginine metabolism
MSVEPVGANLVVIKTPVGSANVVAVDLDRKELPDIAGTVAGDDTIFVAVRSRAAQGRVMAFLHPGGGSRRD